MLGALYFKEPGVYDAYKIRLSDEIAEQILPDGVHYERSLMYHKLILEDLMRTAKSGKTGRPSPVSGTAGHDPEDGGRHVFPGRGTGAHAAVQ